MGEFGSALLTGISVGCIYALTAVGFTIVFNVVARTEIVGTHSPFSYSTI